MIKNCPFCHSEDYVVEANMEGGVITYTMICTACEAQSDLIPYWKEDEI